MGSIPVFRKALNGKKNTGREKMSIELECKEYKKIEEGKYVGTITKLEPRITPEGYKYLDITIKIDNQDTELKYGCPQNLSKISKLGKLISQFVALEAKKTYGLEGILLNKKVSFMVMDETKGDKTYAKIIPDSIKKVEEQ